MLARSLHMHSNEARGDGRSSQEMIADSANTQRVDLAIEQNGGRAHGLFGEFEETKVFYVLMGRLLSRRTRKGGLFILLVLLILTGKLAMSINEAS